MAADVAAKAVSTHSRPKAAGRQGRDTVAELDVSTHSRPKAAGFFSLAAGQRLGVSTHSRPKAAGVALATFQDYIVRFNSQPPEGGWRLR